jgi:hypothetical protein
VFVIRFASIDFSASACRRDTGSGSHFLNELDMTEPQPSRSVKRPTQSLSKRARDWVRPCRQTRRAWACLKNREADSRTPSISDSSDNLCHFRTGWPIFGWNWWRRSKVLGKTGFRGEIGLERFPITWNPVIGKEPLKINKLGQVLIKKVERLFRDLP